MAVAATACGLLHRLHNRRVSAAALAAAAPNDTLRIGSKRFTESYILAQVLAQTAAPHTPHAARGAAGPGQHGHRL